MKSRDIVPVGVSRFSFSEPRPTFMLEATFTVDKGQKFEAPEIFRPYSP